MKWCAADPGSLRGRRLLRSRVCSASLRYAPCCTAPGKRRCKGGEHDTVLRLHLLHRAAGIPLRRPCRGGNKPRRARNTRTVTSTRDQKARYAHRRASSLPAAAIHEGRARAHQLQARRRVGRPAVVVEARAIARSHGPQRHRNRDRLGVDAGPVVRRRPSRPPAVADVERLRGRADPHLQGPLRAVRA